MDELDKIIANLSKGVKYKNEILQEGIDKTNWEKLNTVEPIPNQKLTILKDDPVAQVNYAFKKLEEAAGLNKLTDSFRMPTDTEARSATEISLAKTLDRFTRQHSIICSDG